MPKIGSPDAGDNRITAWLKQPGEKVSRGQALLEVETDKSTVEIEATQSGRLAEIVRAVGAEVPGGETIAFIETEE
jgi:pyruvate/2-oxoglutarate dehydrogenase complex dihydrolipoamide acyltransferase (E2) component